MTTAQRSRQTTKQLKKPMVCVRCKTIHFEYQLTCKRCGEYLDKDDRISEANLGAVKLGLTAAAIMVGIVATCIALHII